MMSEQQRLERREMIRESAERMMERKQQEEREAATWGYTNFNEGELMVDILPEVLPELGLAWK